MDLQPEAEKIGSAANVGLLLSSPFLWKSAKTCKFLTDAYNFIKEKQDDEISVFKRQLELDAMSLDTNLWHPKKNWEQVLGKRHFEIVTSKYSLDSKRKEMVRTQLPNIRNNSVVGLLRVIRNKLSHSALLVDEEKEELNWFRNANGKWEFDEQLFAKYWIEKFPKLLPFLWAKFQKFSDSLMDYYPSPGTSPWNDVQSKLTNFQGQMFNCLSEQLEMGMLQSRYSLGEEPNAIILEFRSLSHTLMQRLLEQSTFLKIEIRRKSVASSWFSKINGTSEVVDERNYKVECRNVNGLTFHGTIFVANSILDYTQQLELILLCIARAQTERIIFFTNSEMEKSDPDLLLQYLTAINAELGIGEPLAFRSIPVDWKELSQLTKEKLENCATINLQGKSMRLKDVLPEQVEEKESMLSALNGTLLNSFLSGNEVKLLDKLGLSSISECYIDRLFSKRIIVNESVFQDAQGIQDTFIISNVFSDIVKKTVISTKEIVIEVPEHDCIKSKLRENPDCRRFLAKNDMENFCKEFARFKRGHTRNNIHCLRYLNNNQFEWIGTKGSTAVMEQNSSNFLIEKWKRNEECFLSFLERRTIREQTIFISDKPGMGKSSVLNSLAKKVSEAFPNKIVLVFTFQKFVEKFIRVRFYRPPKNIVTTIVELLECNEFEEKLVEFWLKADEQLPRKLSFEIFLDGLDEVPELLLEPALESLALIREVLPSVRVWVTLRDHMLPLIYGKFGFKNLGYKLEPFSKYDQIDFLERFWWLKANQYLDIDRRHSSEDLRAFAKKCISIPKSEGDLEISGTPLYCQMIGQHLQNIIFCSKLTVDVKRHLSLVDLYRVMMDRKFEVYVKEKKGFPESIRLDHPILSTYREHLNLFLTYFAMQLIFSEEVAARFRNRLIMLDSHCNDLEKTVLEHGVILCINPLTFLHRTFAEFILAQFCCSVLNCQYLSIPENDSEFRDFLWNEVLAVTVNDSNDSQNCDYKHPTLCQFLDVLLLHKIPPMGMTSQTICLSDGTMGALRGYYGPSLLVAEVIKRAPLFHPVARKVQTGIMILLVNSEDHLFGMFVTALVCQNYRYAKLLIEKCESCAPKNWSKLQDYDAKKRNGIMHWIVQGLYDTGEDPDRKYAVEFYKYILELDSSVLEQRDAEGRTPLLLLLKGGRYPQDLVSLLYELEMHLIFVEDLNANVLATDDNQNTVLHFTHGQYEADTLEDKSELLGAYRDLICYFMDNGCDLNTINSVNCKGESPLFSAFEYFGDMLSPAVKVFRRLGANLNFKNMNGDTILHIAIERNLKLSFIRELIVWGISIYGLNGKGQNALHVALANDNVELVGMLVEHFKVDIESPDENGKTALQHAISTTMRNFIKFQQKVLMKKRKKGSKKELNNNNINFAY